MVKQKLFSLIRKIAKRNASAEYYPFATFAEDGARYLTCGGWLSAETDDIWLFSDVSDEEAKVLLDAFVAGTSHCTYDIQLATHEEADGVGCSSQSNVQMMCCTRKVNLTIL